MKFEINKIIERNLELNFGSTMDDTNNRQVYEALVGAINTILAKKKFTFNKKTSDKNTKNVCYMSMEFLVGKSIKNNLFNLGIEKEVKEYLDKYGIDINKIYDIEPDPGLGNGGLGRLASCYMDALTSQDYSVTGYSILYEFGIFKQIISNGWQMEFPDNWFDLGKYTLMPRSDEEVEVRFYGETKETWTENGLKVSHSGYTSIIAIPYDLLISGYNSEAVNTLRLWRAKAKEGFNMPLFSQGDYQRSSEGEVIASSISKVLYPADDKDEGKILRIKQQYFFVSASLQHIINKHYKKYKTLNNLSELTAVHINDTHPSMCIPEMMRILMDDYSYEWDKAWEITINTCAYTNHTIMSEALEKWSVDLFKPILPRIYTIIKEIDNRFINKYKDEYGDKLGDLTIINNNMLRMANMCIIGSHSVNGVSKLHTEIIKSKTFSSFNSIYPDKFKNVTNGIAHRRWIAQSNSELTEYLKELLEVDFIKDLSKISKLNQYVNDEEVLNKLSEIKRIKKLQLAEYVKKSTGMNINSDYIFDVQVKRLHEYKRQLLNALHILHLYLKIKDGEKVPPRVFIFSAKASSGYYMAKQIIKFICALSDMIEKDSEARKYLQVIFLQDYNVSLAQIIIPSADISEQISQAGKEASGTGNMKLMLNGAVTLGTMDGANVEIFDQVGQDNIFIFGMSTEEVNNLYNQGYKAENYYNQNVEIKRILDFISNKGVNGEDFTELVNYLKHSDPYMNLADFNSYKESQIKVGDMYYNESKDFKKKQLINIANSGIFSADRSTKEYAKNIWNLVKKNTI